MVLAVLGACGFAAMVVVASKTLEADPTNKAAAPAPLNVLIFITDDQRNNIQVMSTVKSQLRDRGRDYPNAYVTTPACCPSRASLMTGRYSHNHGVYTNNLTEHLDHTTTLQFYLRRNGYRTGYIGKFLNQWPLHASPPFFSDWAIDSPEDSNGQLYNGIKVNVNGDVRKVGMYSTTFFQNQAIRFLHRTERANDKRGWLLYVAPNAPHAPFQPAPEYAEAEVPRWHLPPSVLEADRGDKPPWVAGEAVSVKRGRWIRKQQLRLLMSVDDLVQQVLATVEELGERNTLIVFVSDNGYSWGDHGIELKSSPYRASVSVPLILRWPGHLDGGSTDSRLVANIDVAPTIIDATGASTSGGPPMDGRSLLDPTWIRERLVLEYLRAHRRHGIPGWVSLLTPEWQYTEHYYAGGRFYEFYDLTKDPLQMENLWNSTPNNELVDPAIEYLEQDRWCEGVECP